MKVESNGHARKSILYQTTTGLCVGIVTHPDMALRPGTVYSVNVEQNGTVEIRAF